MRSSNGLNIVSATLLLLLHAAYAAAQTCPPADPFGICGLADSHTFIYGYTDSTLSEVIDIQTVSYKTTGRPQPRSMRIEVLQTYPTPVGTYSLAPDNGVGPSLEISLSLEQLFSGGQSAQFSPGSNPRFTGSLQAEPSQLVIDAAGGQLLEDTSYSGAFTMQLDQQSGGDIAVDFTLTVTLEPSIGIYNLPTRMDLTNTNVMAGGNFAGSADFCVGGRGFANYSVELISAHGSTGGSGAEPYELAGLADSTERLPYTAEFNAAPGTISGTFSRLADDSCSTNNASITVSVSENAWQEARQRDYADTLTVTVKAE